MPDVQQILEVERVINLVKGFGWDKTEEVIEGDEVKITFKKTIKAGVSPAPSE